MGADVRRIKVTIPHLNRKQILNSYKNVSVFKMVISVMPA